MSYKNKVFQKLFETKEVELSKEQIELSLLEDIDSEMKELKLMTGSVNDTVRILESAKEDAKKFVSKTDKIEANLNKMLSKYEAAAKELGLPSGMTGQVVKNVSSVISDYKAAKAKIN